LSDDLAVKNVIAGIVSTNLVKGKIVVDTSTISPKTSAEMTKELAWAGAAYVSAPAFGATPVAVEGRLLFAIAGQSDAILAVKPIIEACLARSIIVVGEEPAQATLLKTTGNFITAAMAETISEAHVLAEKSGLSNDVLDELIRENYGTYAHSISRKLVEGVYCPPRGERPRSDLVLAIKDVSHGIDAAAEAGTRLKLAEVTMEHLVQAKKWADGQQRALDSSSVYGVARMDAGLDFESNLVKEHNAGGG
jgi:3-hydroxyisobutyrate dehydrogenase-like beta-hydroxyacid dehydrogenase